MVVAVLEKERHDQAFKEIRFENLPRSTMRHPSDDIMELFLCKDGIKLDGELLYANGTLHASTRYWRRGRRRRISHVCVFLNVSKVAVLVDGGSIRILIVRNETGELGFWFCIWAVAHRCVAVLALVLISSASFFFYGQTRQFN
jgi:hypothetical protein